MRPRFDKWLDRPDNQADLTYEEWLDNYVAVLELDAQRYRKLESEGKLSAVVFHSFTGTETVFTLSFSVNGEHAALYLDAAVDPLPEPGQKGGK